LIHFYRSYRSAVSLGGKNEASKICQTELNGEWFRIIRTEVKIQNVQSIYYNASHQAPDQNYTATTAIGQLEALCDFARLRHNAS
jgi:hypothetical protein